MKEKKYIVIGSLLFVCILLVFGIIYLTMMKKYTSGGSQSNYPNTSQYEYNNIGYSSSYKFEGDVGDNTEEISVKVHIYQD